VKKVALITGASAGLGVEFARQLSKRGHRLVLAARRIERLEQLAKELGNARAVAIDLSKANAPAKLMADLEAAGEQVEILVNNAGFGLIGRFAELDSKRLRQMIDLNVGALTDLCRAIAPGMIRRSSGAILNVASTAAFQPLPGSGCYAATKAFVLSLSEASHSELRGLGITVTALCPGPVKTEFGEVAGVGEKEGQLPRPFWTSVQQVAEDAVDGLEKGKRVVVPGVLNRGGALSGQHIPRAAFLPLANRFRRAAL
jgi:uncharacterized protein